MPSAFHHVSGTNLMARKETAPPCSHVDWVYINQLQLFAICSKFLSHQKPIQSSKADCGAIAEPSTKHCRLSS